MMFQRGNPMTSTVLSVLVFEVIVAGLAIPGIVLVEGRSAGVAGLWCGLVMALALLGAGLLRRGSVGWVLAWAAQLGLVLLGLLTPMMWLVGLLFALLFVTCVVLGRRIEAHRAA